MKGILLTEFGKPYTFSSDIPAPKITNDNDVLIKVAVAGYCRSEKLIQDGEFALMMQGRELPMVPSHECAGVVVQVGANVKNVKVGRLILSRVYISCPHEQV